MNRINFFLTIAIFCTFQINVFTQKNDFNWIIGGNSINVDTLGYLWGTTQFDFNFEPVKIYYNDSITLDMSGTDTGISNKNGALRAYTNGMSVHGFDHLGVDGLDTIGYGQHWERFNIKDYFGEGEDWVSGFPIGQGFLFLPYPMRTDEYLLFQRYISYSDDGITLEEKKLLYSQLKFDTLTSSMKSNFKDKVFMEGSFSTSFSAVTHANGRDYWLVTPAAFNKELYLFLIEPNGVEIKDTFNVQHPLSSATSISSSKFSPNGNKYGLLSINSSFDTCTLLLYDFDRCIGTLDFIGKKDYKPYSTIGSFAFSNDGMYLYVTFGLELYQYDMNSEDIFSSGELVGIYDGTVFTYFEGAPPIELTLGYMTLAPDGRIYMCPPGNVRSMHTIEFPDLKGEDCGLLQNKFVLPTQNFNSMPNMHFPRLGPVDGSGCDTLDINNIPKSKFRYDQVNNDYLELYFTDLSYYEPTSWYWDFGDGTISVERNPGSKKYEDSGEYEVCLTVENKYGTDKKCNDIFLGITGLYDEQFDNLKISLYPNPVKDNLHILISDFIPRNCILKIYNNLGQTILTKNLKYDWNRINLGTVENGILYYSIFESENILKSGTILKI